MIDERYRDKVALIVAMLKKEADFDDRPAFEVALRVMNYFGYSDEIIDNALDSDDRKLFYFMQDLGILGTRWEEMQLINGKNWRIFYWMLKESKMRRTVSMRERVWRSTDIYISLPEAVWAKKGRTTH